MKIIAIIILLTIVVAVQLTVMPFFGFLGATPNLLLAVAVILAIYQKEEKIGWVVFVFAVLLDLLVGRPFGLIALSIWLVFWILQQPGKNLFKQSGFVSLAVLSVIGCLLYEFFLIGFAILATFLNYGISNIIWKDLYTVLPISIIYNTLICFIVYTVLKRFSTILSRLNLGFKPDQSINFK